MITKSSILKDIPLETDLSTIFGMVKTVNGQFPDNNGNVNIKSENNSGCTRITFNKAKEV